MHRDEISGSARNEEAYQEKVSLDSPNPTPNCEATNAVLKAEATNATDLQPEDHVVMDHMAGKYDRMDKLLEDAVPLTYPETLDVNDQNSSKNVRGLPHRT